MITIRPFRKEDYESIERMMLKEDQPEDAVKIGKEGVTTYVLDNDGIVEGFFAYNMLNDDTQKYFNVIHFCVEKGKRSIKKAFMMITKLREIAHTEKTEGAITNVPLFNSKEKEDNKRFIRRYAKSEPYCIVENHAFYEIRREVI